MQKIKPQPKSEENHLEKEVIREFLKPKSEAWWKTRLEYAFPPKLLAWEKQIIRNNVSELLSQARQEAIEECIKIVDDIPLLQYPRGEIIKRLQDLLKRK